MRRWDLAASFIKAINAHDPKGIVALCTPDHRLIDAHGNVVTFEGLESAWQAYFRLMPHYGIDVEEMVGHADQVAIFGCAWGGLNEDDPADRSWRRPCAWRMHVSMDRVSLWQVYVDTKAVFDLF